MVFQMFGCVVWRKTAARERAFTCPANTIRYSCNKKPYREIKLRLARSAHVHLVEILLIPSGFCFSRTSIDRCNRWPEAVLSDIAAEIVAKVFVKVLVTPSAARNSLNRSGMRFEARPFKTLAGIIGFHLIKAKKWYPAAKCIIKRFHRYLTARLLCHAHKYWVEAVLLVFTGNFSAWKKAIDASSADLVYEKPCICWQYSSPSHSPTKPTLLTSKPG